MLRPLVFKAPVLQSLDTRFLRTANVSVRVLRLDLINPLVSGNKWYKLKYNLAAARARGSHTLLSFGGAWSNHLYALAAAARAEGFASIGVIRGELVQPLNPVLQFAREQGMQLYPVSRSRYREKHQPDFLDSLRQELGDFFLIPEGGSNLAGLRGCAEIVDALPVAPPARQSDRFLLAACGTGTMLAGLLSGLSASPALSHYRVIGVPVLKGGDYLAAEITGLLAESGMTPASQEALHWELATDHHCGGYAKTTPELMAFMAEFSEETGLPLEPVYTGKLFLALHKLVECGRIPADSEVLIIHSGGALLQH